MLIYKSKENALPYKFVIHALLRTNWLVQFWNVRTPPFTSHSGSIPDVLLTPTKGVQNTTKKGVKTMARIPMVTRTLTATNCDVLCCDVKAGSTVVKTVTVPRTYKTDEQLMKVVKSLIETDDIKPVHIKSKTVTETLYGMTEAEFMENAKVLPPRESAPAAPAKKSK